MEHTHISDTVKMVSVLHHFFIAPAAAAAAIFPFVLKTLFRERGAELLVSEPLLLYFGFYRGRNGQQCTVSDSFTDEHGSREKYFGVKKVFVTP